MTESVTPTADLSSCALLSFTCRSKIKGAVGSIGWFSYGKLQRRLVFISFYGGYYLCFLMREGGMKENNINSQKGRARPFQVEEVIFVKALVPELNYFSWWKDCLCGIMRYTCMTGHRKVGHPLNLLGEGVWVQCWGEQGSYCFLSRESHFILFFFFF